MEVIYTVETGVVITVTVYVFYGTWDWRFLALIWVSTAVDYACAIGIANAGSVDAGSFVVDVNGAHQTIDDGLAVDEKVSLWFSGFSSGENVAFVDATMQVDEMNELNNEVSQILPVPTLPLPTILSESEGDRREPRVERPSIVEPIEVAVSAHERILGQLSGGVVVLEQGNGEAQEPALTKFDDTLVGIAPAGADLGEGFPQLLGTSRFRRRVAGCRVAIVGAAIAVRLRRCCDQFQPGCRGPARPE